MCFNIRGVQHTRRLNKYRTFETIDNIVETLFLNGIPSMFSCVITRATSRPLQFVIKANKIAKFYVRRSVSLINPYHKKQQIPENESTQQ